MRKHIVQNNWFSILLIKILLISLLLHFWRKSGVWVRIKRVRIYVRVRIKTKWKLKREGKTNTRESKNGASKNRHGAGVFNKHVYKESLKDLLWIMNQNLRYLASGTLKRFFKLWPWDGTYNALGIDVFSTESYNEI